MSLNIALLLIKNEKCRGVTSADGMPAPSE